MEQRPIRWLLMVAGLAVLAVALGGCASEQERRISALHHFKKGNAAFTIEDYANAIRHFQMALEIDPESAEVTYNLGLAYFKSANHELAVETFLDVVRKAPEMADAHFNLALAYDRLYQPDAAHAHYNRYKELTGGANAGREAAQAAPPVQNRPELPGSPIPTPGEGRRPTAATLPSQPPPRPRTVPAARPQAPAVPSEAGPLGGNDKWWIQDRFTRSQ